MIRSRRLWVRWSTHAPRNRPSRLGSQISAVRTLTCTGVAVSRVTAISGRASSLTRSPNEEIVSPAQKVRNRRSRCRAGGGTAPVALTVPAAVTTWPVVSPGSPGRGVVAGLGQEVAQHPDDPRAVRGRRLLAPHVRSDQLFDRLLQLPQLVGGGHEPGVGDAGQRAPLGVQSGLLAQQPLLRRVGDTGEHLAAQLLAGGLPLDTVGRGETEAPGCGLPPAFPLAGGALPVGDQTERREVPQVPADHRGGGPDVRREPGRRGRAVPLKVFEDRQPHRVGQRPQRLRLGDLEIPVRILERHVSKVVSQIVAGNPCRPERPGDQAMPSRANGSTSSRSS